MGRPRFSVLFSIIIAASGQLVFLACCINGDESNKFKAMFIFGDSLFDAGNGNFRNGSKADFWPYGETFFHFPTGRVTDGRIVPDFLSVNMEIPLWRPYLEPGNHSFLHGADFAFPGAAVFSSDIVDPAGVSLRGQLAYFEEVASFLEQELGHEEATKLLNEAIYLSSIGGGDYLTYIGDYSNATQEEHEEFVNVVVGNITEVIKEIYKLGGRKFAFQNVGPMGCMPMVKQILGLLDGACSEELLTLPILHNKALANVTAELESQLPGFKYLIFDYYRLILNRITNPSKYGLVEVGNACCGSGPYRGLECGVEPYELCSNPSEYLWFDGGHPPEYVNQQLASLLWQGGSSATKPYNLKQLFQLNPHKEISPPSGSWFSI